MEIGGFPTDSVTEDYLLSLRLKEKGFLTAYLNEPLTYGLAPEGLKEYIAQRSRWCLGFMQIARGRSGPLSVCSPLAFIDRLSLTEVFLNWTAVPLSRAIGLIIPPLSLALGLHPFHASLYDLATRFLPYFLWSGLVMSWLSGGKVMPILFDVSQIIVMPQILKAALFGLARPQGQKFQVTAKGGDRNHGFVEWTVMRPFVILIVLSLAAVLWAFYVNGGSNEIHYSSPALAWTWYNLIVLVVLCFVCVERPRHRAAERFASRELVSVRTAERTQLMQLADVSITGARIFGVPPGAPGQSIELELPNFSVSATDRPSRRGHVRRRFQPHLEVKGGCDPAFLFRRVSTTARLDPHSACRGIGGPKGVRLSASCGSCRCDRYREAALSERAYNWRLDPNIICPSR